MNEIDLPPLEGELQCGKVEHKCICTLPPHKQGPDSPHVCGAPHIGGNNGCGGSWYFDAGRFMAVTFPSGPSLFDNPLAFLFSL